MTKKPIRVQGLLRNFRPCTHGFAVAEFAIVIPAIIMIAVISLWLLSLCIRQVQLETAAGSIARELSRHNSNPEVINQLTPAETKLHTKFDGEFVVAELQATEQFPFRLFPLRIDLHACSRAIQESS